MPVYVNCPKCQRFIGLKKNGEMKLHRVDTGYLSKGTLFPYCAYAGCTPQEARDGVTYLMKRREEFLRRGGVEGAMQRLRKKQEAKRRQQ